MKSAVKLVASVAFGASVLSGAIACEVCGKSPVDRAASATQIPKIRKAEVKYDKQLDQYVFELNLDGSAKSAVPEARGKLDTAPVVGFVFPTTLEPEAVGFKEVEGIVALAVTTHPDFDDTPLWDEDGDANYGNDGVVYHPHWVVLAPDDRVAGGLSVVAAAKERLAEILPPTNPGMPMYMDSPGYPVVLGSKDLKVVVPGYRIRGASDFKFDAVSCYMEVNASDGERPMLGVYAVYQVLSGDLSLPFEVK